MCLGRRKWLLTLVNPTTQFVYDFLHDQSKEFVLGHWDEADNFVAFVVFKNLTKISTAISLQAELLFSDARAVNRTLRRFAGDECIEVGRRTSGLSEGVYSSLKIRRL